MEATRRVEGEQASRASWRERSGRWPGLASLSQRLGAVVTAIVVIASGLLSAVFAIPALRMWTIATSFALGRRAS
jgi:hypothetical protein